MRILHETCLYNHPGLHCQYIEKAPADTFFYLFLPDGGQEIRPMDSSLTRWWIFLLQARFYIMKRKRRIMQTTQTITTKSRIIPPPVKTKQTTFKVKAIPGAEVFLAGSFNNWDPSKTRMKQNGDGSYAVKVRIPPGKHEYKFLVNGTWQVDPDCGQWVSNGFGSLNSVIEVK